MVNAVLNLLLSRLARAHPIAPLSSLGGGSAGAGLLLVSWVVVNVFSRS